MPVSRAERSATLRNINYQFNCRRCDAKIIEKVQNQELGGELRVVEELDLEEERPQYRGETSRTPFTRAQAHYSNYQKGKKSFMFNHVVEKHGGDVRSGQEDVEKVMVAKDQDVMRRQLREAIRIKKGMDGKKENLVVKIAMIGEENKRSGNLCPNLPSKWKT